MKILNHRGLFWVLLILALASAGSEVGGHALQLVSVSNGGSDQAGHVRRRTEQEEKPLSRPRSGQTSPRSSRQAQTQDEPAEVVELRSDLVIVTATVVGPRGELKKDLTREDFEILEDGVPQEIVLFAGEASVPLRLVVIFDASLSVKSRFEFEKQAVARFFKSILQPNDRAALISVNTDVILQQDFTADASKLISAVSELRSEGATALYDATSAAADHLRGAEGRRVIVILSDGRDTISRLTLAQALKRAQEVNAVIYAVNTSGPPPSANLRELIGETALETLANQTGGEVFFPNKLEELDPAFARLAEQVRTQYVLGFHSSNEARDGSFRRLTVRVKREGTFVRARTGYYAPKK